MGTVNEILKHKDTHKPLPEANNPNDRIEKWTESFSTMLVQLSIVDDLPVVFPECRKATN